MLTAIVVLCNFSIVGKSILASNHPFDVVGWLFEQGHAIHSALRTNSYLGRKLIRKFAVNLWFLQSFIRGVAQIIVTFLRD
jgi:hypothetical protein